MEKRIAVVGLGYVGLPLAVEFGRKYPVVGFDINPARVSELQSGHDHTLEADLCALNEVLRLHTSTQGACGLQLSSDKETLREANTYIVTVPTPIDRHNNPDLTALLSASRLIGQVLKKGDLVIYESTTYPGCTEEDCVPVLEEASGLRLNTDFGCGYSPERINPGDKVNTLTKIRKITSGSNADVAEDVDNLYRSIITAGTYKAPSIRVAEAAKAVENSQRDLNISFMNELALICDRVGIDTNDVIDAAGTKWNFIQYRPGLVGGHCISVDPYYLAHKAKELGYEPRVILSGRAVNNSISKFVADKTLKLMIERNRAVRNAPVLLLGVTFKENCPDYRNTKVPDIAKELEAFGCEVDVYDPWVDAEAVAREYGIHTIEQINPERNYSAIVACVAHDAFREIDLQRYKDRGCVIFDVKGKLDRRLADARL